MWMQDVERDRGVEEGSWDMEYVYPEDGMTLQELQPHSHFWVPWWVYRIFVAARWLHRCAESLCKLYAANEEDSPWQKQASKE